MQGSFSGFGKEAPGVAETVSGGKCVVLAALYAGEEPDFLRREEGDLLICADRGYAAARSFGLAPDLVVGDFDSMPADRLTEADRGRTLFLPRAKDDTDTAVCVAEGRKRGYRIFRVGGGLGGRLDHTLANLQLAADCALRGESLWLCDARNRASVLAPGAYVLPRMPGRYLSLMAYTEEVRGVTLTGARWPLDGAALLSRRALGVSNEWTAEEARLSFAEGLLAVFFSGDA